MEQIDLIPGNQYLYLGNAVRIILVLDLKHVMVEYVATGSKDRILISALQPITTVKQLNGKIDNPVEILSVTDENWLRAQQRLKILAPILENRGDFTLVNEIAKRYNLSKSTVYRWLSLYDLSGSVVSLADQPRLGGKGKARIEPDLELIIDKAIAVSYMNNQRKQATRVILEVQMQCQNLNLTPPSENTIRRRIKNLPMSEVVRYRMGLKASKEQFSPIKGSFPGADFPLAVVQIDHTLVDIILVDEHYRKVVGKPWLTLAIDVYSRCVVGFYLSFDPPGAVGTGACIAHAILPKELWLSKTNVQGEWNCWGTMQTIHVDNAREFHGKMLKMACDKYGINLDFRPAGTPNFGGHIERLMGTFMNEVHTLKGTTFSNPRQRKGYDSEKEAAMSLSELEHWLTEFIVNVYHKRIHSGTNYAPVDKYREGIFGSADQPGRGLPKRLLNERQVRLDFLPIEERTIQEYGVLIDHIYYYDDVLRKYINSIDLGSGKSRLKRKFIFKRDPRDISCVYFFDQETMQYHRIPYRDTSRPMMSLWEHKEVLKRLKAAGRENINEGDIFDGYENMRKIELGAIEKTRKISKNRNRMIQGSNVDNTFVAEKFFVNEGPSTDNDQTTANRITINKSLKMKILPFEGLDND